MIVKNKLNIKNGNKYSKISLYHKFINFFFLMGKKRIIKQQIDSVFKLLSKEFKVSPITLLYHFFNRLKTYVEIKKVKKRLRVFLVPIPTSICRRLHLGLKWLFSSICLNKLKISFEKKLYVEMLNILLNQSCPTLDFLEKNNKLSIESRINLHYRW